MRVSFTGTPSSLKSYFKKGLLPSVKYGLYGDKITKSNFSIEHIVPRSYGGKTELSNLAIASKARNGIRSNFPIKDYLVPAKAIKYLLQFKDINLPNLNGNKYIADILELLHRLQVL